MNRSCWHRIFQAVLACFIFQSGHAQNLSNSKISLHLIGDYTAGSSNVVAGRPQLLKVLAVDPNFPPGQLAAMRDFKSKAPGGKIVVRVYSPKTYWTNDDPTLSAGDFWTNHMLPALNQLSPSDKQLIDYLEGPNEGETPTLGYPYDGGSRFAARWFNEFWTNLTPMMVSAGYKPCVGSIAVGNPEIYEFDYFVPALRQAKAAGGAWSYHAYTINYTTDVTEEIWYSLRYRQVNSYFSQYFPDLANMTLILTEAGVDFSGSPTLSGWQARGSAANYQRWLNWFDHQMQQDSYVLGCTLFQNGDASGWPSFDLETIMPGAQPGVVPITGWMKNYLINPTTVPAAPKLFSNYSPFPPSPTTNVYALWWTNIATSPTVYNIKRATNSAGPFALVARNVTEGVKLTGFRDWSVPARETNFYVVSAINAMGESTNSSFIRAFTPLPKINCGGTEVEDFLADNFYSAGEISVVTNVINTSAARVVAPQSVYQTQRYGNFIYTIPGLKPKTAHTLVLHFAEIYFSNNGSRVFDVLANGAKVLGNFDIVVAAGGSFKANDQWLNVISDASGNISVEFRSIVNNAACNGIEILPARSFVFSGPTNLSATVGSGNISLAWDWPEGAASFGVRRSSGTGPYGIIASNLTASSFTDSSVISGITYNYIVFVGSGTNANYDSPAAIATATNSLPDVIATSVSWSPPNPGPGTNVIFSVTVKNQGSASVAANSLGIGFLVDGQQVSWVGAGNAALAAGASAPYSASGGPNGVDYWKATPALHMITAVVDDINRFAEGNENNNLFSVPMTIYAQNFAINSGSNAAGIFSADTNWIGSPNTFTTTTAINVSGVSNAAPQAVYQSERWGNTTYIFTNLVPGKLYKTRLHFSEISPSVTQAGQRQFHTLINNQMVLTNFDIFTSAGGKFRALTKQFNTAADDLGGIFVQMTRGDVNEPKISGLEIFPYTNTAPVLAAIGTKTVNTGASFTYTNTATDADLPADILTFSAAGLSTHGTIDSATGVLSWTAAQTSTGLTNLVSVSVTDNGTPPLNNIKTLVVITIPPPRVDTFSLTNGTVNLSYKTYPGKKYKVQFKTDLNEPQWSDLGSETTAAGYSLSFSESVAGRRFYRIAQVD